MIIIELLQIISNILCLPIINNIKPKKNPKIVPKHFKSFHIVFHQNSIIFKRKKVKKVISLRHISKKKKEEEKETDIQ